MTKRLDERVAVAVMRTAGVEPLVPYPTSNTRWACRCLACGREVYPTYANVRSGHKACAYCAGRKVEPAERIAVLSAAGLTPLVPFPGKNKPWRSRCNRCGREVSPTYTHIKMRGRGCAYCGKRRVDLSEVWKVMRAADLEPLEDYPGNKRHWRCRCLKCGREVRCYYNTVQQGSGACASCAIVGFQPTEPAYLYLLHHPDGAWKLGITGNPRRRLKDHRYRGGFEAEFVAIWGPLDGILVQQLECDIVADWRSREWPVGLPPEVTGYTETIPDSLIDEADLVRSIATRIGEPRLVVAA